MRTPQLGKQRCALGDETRGAYVVTEPELVKAGLKIIVERTIAKPHRLKFHAQVAGYA